VGLEISWLAKMHERELGSCARWANGAKGEGTAKETLRYYGTSLGQWSSQDLCELCVVDP